MKRKLIIILLSSTVSTFNVYSLNLKQYIDQIVAAHDQLVSSIKDLQDGKTQIANIYAQQLKPDLFDSLDKSIKDIHDQSDSIKDAIDGVKSLPSLVLAYISIPDLQPTLQWTIDNPLKTIQNQLQSVEDKFNLVAQKLETSDQVAQTQKKIDDILANTAQAQKEVVSAQNDRLKILQKLETNLNNLNVGGFMKTGISTNAAQIQQQIDDINAQNAQSQTEILNIQNAQNKDLQALINKLNREKIGSAMYANFDLAIAKLQAAVCNMERTMRALRANFTPYPTCSK